MYNSYLLAQYVRLDELIAHYRAKCQNSRDRRVIIQYVQKRRMLYQTIIANDVSTAQYIHDNLRYKKSPPVTNEAS